MELFSFRSLGSLFWRQRRVENAFRRECKFLPGDASIVASSAANVRPDLRSHLDLQGFATHGQGLCISLLSLIAPLVLAAG
jgi:hypothetical protein